LGEIGDASAAPRIVPYLRDGDERTRIRAVAALCALRDVASLPALVECFSDAELTVRNAAAIGLEQFGTDAVGPLEASLDASADHVALRLRTLGRIAVGLREAKEPPAHEALARARRLLLAQLDASVYGKTPAAVAAAAEGLLALEDPELKARVAQRLAEETDPLLRRCYEQAKRQ
jgi:HEAT repeat protein